MTLEDRDRYLKDVNLFSFSEEPYVSLEDYFKCRQEIDRLNNLINTIFDFNFFKEECPLNFGFSDENEEKSQNVFYEDDYCEKNCNDEYKKCWLKYFKRLQELKEEGKKMKFLYELPERQNIKLYIDDKVIIFDHIDGAYSYCWFEEDKNKIVHIKATTTFKKYKDGYKYVESKGDK